MKEANRADNFCKALKIICKINPSIPMKEAVLGLHKLLLTKNSERIKTADILKIKNGNFK